VRLDEIRGWDDVKLLTVQVDRLRQWYIPGLLCIGDAAHAMSPVGGVGINLAIQDAVAAANRLAGPLAEGRVTLDDLRAVQSRRVLPTRVSLGQASRAGLLTGTGVARVITSRDCGQTEPTDQPLARRTRFWRRTGSVRASLAGGMADDGGVAMLAARS
jgi:2-polyprenyl-6-methoxyphenol hydroxylase-like FAD-dependent oxidoreductase